MPAPRVRPRVLVVDDDPGIRGMLQLALSSRGYLVDAVADHRGGWSGDPDVVLLDARLGAYTAADFLSAVRLGPDTAVVLMTASESLERVASELGADAVIAKPFDLRELFELVACLTS